MTSKTTTLLFSRIDQYKEEGTLPEKYSDILKTFITEYEKALPVPEAFIQCRDRFLQLIEQVKEQCIEPFLFSPFHSRVRTPFDYYQFGIDILKPLIDMEHSQVEGLSHVKHIYTSLKKGENAIFLANHQTEADPHAISILLEATYPTFAEEMIFVAGERVITDPLAIPFSMGRNLLCIYSKRYIDHPPEHKMRKQLHNKRTMELMSELLSEGGKAIYVAPSGGRDRPNAAGVFEVAPFDPQSIEMLYLMAERAGQPTHFYPMALKTYSLVPPPQTIQVELGETRIAQRANLYLAFGPQIDMQHYPGSDLGDKHSRRAARATYIHHLVREYYSKFP